MDLQTLTDHFAIPSVLAFSENEHGLIRAAITTPACTAELYLQGAHLTQWQPTGQKPALFLSDRSAFIPGKAIRGGVPLIFPWFGGRTATAENQRTDGPSHGFARTADWTLAFAALGSLSRAAAGLLRGETNDLWELAAAGRDLATEAFGE